jgi:hypothetical protein
MVSEGLGKILVLYELGHTGQKMNREVGMNDEPGDKTEWMREKE